jgi:hypothetical protein
VNSSVGMIIVLSLRHILNTTIDQGQGQAEPPIDQGQGQAEPPFDQGQGQAEPPIDQGLKMTKVNQPTKRKANGHGNTVTDSPCRVGHRST